MLRLSLDRLGELYAAVAAKQGLYLPIEKADQVDFARWTPDAKVRLDVLKTVKSAKDAFFPQSEDLARFKVDGKKIEMLAMNAVMETEKALGNTVVDVSADKCGWDITSRYPAPTSKDEPIRADRHIEVKGRVKGATDVIMTCNEISYAVNQGDKFILALVLVDGDKTEGPYYIRNIWQNELNFGVEHEAYKIADLMTKAEKPENTK